RFTYSRLKVELQTFPLQFYLHLLIFFWSSVSAPTFCKRVNCIPAPLSYTFISPCNTLSVFHHLQNHLHLYIYFYFSVSAKISAKISATTSFFIFHWLCVSLSFSSCNALSAFLHLHLDSCFSSPFLQGFLHRCHFSFLQLVSATAS